MLYHHTRIAVLAAATLCPAALLADVPRVVTDIPPVHGLVSQVMEGVGTPELILPPGASPHGYAMRPSEARALSQADLVIWVGHDLTPWLENGIETLAPEAAQLELLEVDGLRKLTFRETAVFGAVDEEDHDGHGHHEHAHDKEHGHDEHAQDKEHGHDEHAHDKEHGHDAHAHDKEHAHDDHAHDKEDHAHEEHAGHGHDDHGHAHGADATDPHAWLDPKNAELWLMAIAAQLSEMDPENSAAYAANAEQAVADLAAQSAAISQRLAEVNPGAFVVFHDAYQYFESRFGLKVAGAFRLADAAAPSAARVAALKERVEAGNISCIFSEPQYDPAIVASVADGVQLNVAVLDPLGTALTPGPGLYPALLESLVSEIEGCL